MALLLGNLPARRLSGHRLNRGGLVLAVGLYREKAGKDEAEDQEAG